MNNNSEYFSLQEATQYCNYSQEYLSLRARQGKLKSVKFGRNWVTKKEWLDEYLKEVEEYNNNNFKHYQISAPPENLPIERTEIRRPPMSKPVPLIRFGFVAVLTFVLLVAGIFYIKEGFKIVYQDTSSVGRAGNITVESTPKVISDTISDTPQVLSRTKLTLVRGFTTVFLSTAAIGDAFKEYGQWVTRNTSEWFNSQIKEIVQNYTKANDFIERKIRQGYKIVAQFWAPKKIVEEELVPKLGEEGIVFIPSSEKDEEVKKKIKEAFSDEVRVEPEDKTSGVIIPIFKKGEGQKYLYILVPVDVER